MAEKIFPGVVSFFEFLRKSAQELLAEFRDSQSKEPKSRALIKVKGRIFEGSYHVYAEQQARNYRFKGWMKVRDGLSQNAFLEMEVEGAESKVKSYIMDLRKGNRDSNVTLVTVEWKPIGNPPFSGFQRLL